MTNIQTPYGKKTPELLCKAMDAHSAMPDILTTLRNLESWILNYVPSETEGVQIELHELKNAIEKIVKLS